MPGRSTPYPGLSGSSSPPRETLTVSPPLLRVGGELTSAGSRPVRVRPVAASAAAVERAAGATGRRLDAAVGERDCAGADFRPLMATYSA
jgi:hypothetical protein